MSKLKCIIFSISLLALFFATDLTADTGALHTEMTEPQYKSYLGQALMWQARLAVDEKKFYPAFYATGVMNRTFLILFRFQPENTDTLNLYGPHMSILFDSRSDLVGMVRVKPEWAGQSRVSDKTAVERGAAFIWSYAPDLFRFVNSPDILDYQVEARKNGGALQQVDGVLVRYTDTRSGRCFFVIVAPDKSVMAFERNVKWDPSHHSRQNESFLYDAWLEKNGYRRQ